MSTGEAACPRCGATLRTDQDWCLECGAAGRTRLARAAAWRTPVIAALIAVAIAGGAAAFAFVRLANTDQDVRAGQVAPTTTAAPAGSSFTTTTAP